MRRLLVLAAIVALAPSSQAARTGGTPVALVTAETLNQLLVVRDGKVVKRIRMPADPQNVEVDNRNAVVVSPHSGAVTIVGIPALRVRRILRGFGSPHIVLMPPSANGKFAYVTDDARGQLVVVDLRRKRVVRRVFVGKGAHHMALSPGGARLWVALGERAPSIVVVDTTSIARPRAIARVNPHGLAHDLAFGPNGTRVWVTYDDRALVGVFDARTGRRIRLLKAGTPPQHVAFNPFSPKPRFYLTSGNDGTLSIVSLRTSRVVHVTRTAKGSFNLGFGGSFVVVPSLYSGTLTWLRDDGRVLWSRQVAPAARDAAIAVLP